MPPLSNPTIIVTGASRGLGLEFVRQIAARWPGGRIAACVRDLSKGDEVRKAGGGKVEVVQLDADSESSISKAAAEIERLFPDGIDVLVNNAGRLISGVPPLETTGEQLNSTFLTNVVGPVLISESLVPSLHKKETKVILNISSIMGSMARSASGGDVSYRVSKAALNMATHCFAKTLGPEGFIVVPIHPGWVSTDMGGPTAPVSPEQSVKGMLDVVESLGEGDNGRFRSFDGGELPW
ncbi:hypothetical protein DFJ74DRAFT_634863 [Hyaloraphidium curvatum]|nr:hypothetical protein DFJ74DRAFT_634863 [Hyaloraphidium curvatum]